MVFEGPCSSSHSEKKLVSLGGSLLVFFSTLKKKIIKFYWNKEGLAIPVGNTLHIAKYIMIIGIFVFLALL